MEAQAYLIGAAVVIISAILIYLIALVTMREKSYDDILAEQRKRREDLYSSKPAPDKLKQKKKSKKKVRQERVDLTDGEGSIDEQEQLTKMVELELEPEIIEDVPKAHKGPKGKKQKSILLNKQEKVVVSDNVAAAEAPRHRATPKDAVALKQERERRLSETPIETAVSAPVTQAAPEVVDKVRKREKREKREVEMIRPEVETEQVQEAVVPQTSAKDQRRAKKAKEALASGDSVKADSTQIIATVQAASLNNADIQALIEVLLGKQGGRDEPSDKWKTKSPKGDPVEMLERQVTEKNQALKEEKEQAQVAVRRVKDVQQELARERQQYALLEKDLNDKLSTQLQDIQALQLRMQKTHEQHRVEVTTLKMQVDQRQGQITDGQAVMLQCLQEDNRKLQDKATNAQKQLKIVQDELNKQIQEKGSADGSRKQIESKLIQYEDKIRKLEANQRDTENVLSQKYKEVSEHFQREQAKSATLVRDLEKATGEKHHRERELANTRNLMKDLENVKGQREHELHDLQAHLQSLREENTTLATDLKTYRERTSGEGQEDPAKPQGAVSTIIEEPKLDQSLVLRSEHDNLLHAKDLEINQLKADLEARLADLSLMEQLKNEIDIQKKKNNDLEVDKSKACADTIAAGRDAAVAHEQIEQLRQQLENKSTELQKISATMDSVKQDNDGFQRQIHALESSSWSAATTAEELCQLQQTLQTQTTELQQKEELLKTHEDTIKQWESQLQSQTQQMQELNQALQSYKEQLCGKDEQLESHSKVLQAKEDQLESLSKQLVDAQNMLKSYSEKQSSQNDDVEAKSKELQDQEAVLQQLRDQLQQQETELQQRDSQIAQQKQQLEQQLQQLQDKEQSLASQTQKLHDQQSSLETKTLLIKEQELSLEKNTTQLKDQEHAIREQQQQLEEKQDQLLQQEEQVKQDEMMQQSQSESLQSELDSLKQENDELRQKNWKAMDALQQAEARAQSSGSAAEELADIKKSLQKLFPHVQLTESTTWLVEIEQHMTQQQSKPTQVTETNADLSELESELSESKQSNNRLEGQVQHYKLVLADTESILNKLQNSVESEEQNWIKKLHKTEEDLTKARSENSKLSDEVKQLSSNKQSLTNGAPVHEDIDELKEMLSSTQNLLDKEVQTNQQLIQKLGASAESESSSV